MIPTPQMIEAAKAIADKIAKAMEEVNGDHWIVWRGQRGYSLVRAMSDLSVMRYEDSNEVMELSPLPHNLNYMALCNPANMRVLLSALPSAAPAPQPVSVKALLSHFEQMQRMASMWLAPDTYVASFPKSDNVFDTVFGIPEPLHSPQARAAINKRRDDAFISDIIRMLDGPEQRAVEAAIRSALSSPVEGGTEKEEPKVPVVDWIGTVACPCTTFEQDESSPVGYPSLLCGACGGKGVVKAETVISLAAEMLKVAEQVDELEDPFAAWESIELLKSAASPSSAEIEALRVENDPLTWMRLGARAMRLSARAKCGNHWESSQEDAMTSGGLSKLDKQKLYAEANASEEISRVISETCEDSALGYASYMADNADKQTLAKLGVTSDWLYRRHSGEPSRKELSARATLQQQEEGK